MNTNVSFIKQIFLNFTKLTKIILSTAFQTEIDMINYLKKDFEYKVFGVSILNESISNFTYKLRFPNTPRNEDRNTDWSNWKTNLLSPIFPQLGPRSKMHYTGGDPGNKFFILIN